MYKVGSFINKVLMSMSMVIAYAHILALLFRHRQDLREVEIVIAPDRFVDFGHAVHMPDTARRQYAGQNILFFNHFEMENQNPLLATIWPDLKMINVFRPSFRINALGKALEFPPGLAYCRAFNRILVVILRRVFPKVTVLTQDTVYEKMTRPPVFDGLQFPKQGQPYLGHDRMNMIAGTLSWIASKQKVSRCSLPSEFANPVSAAISKILEKSSGSNKRLCLFYQRRGPENSLRDGSELQEYLPAIEHLIENSYLVLATGDVPIPPEISERLNGMLVDAAILNICRDSFRLYAALECDILVGDCGGGSWLSGVNDIPRLLLNVYPPSVSFHKCWTYPSEVWSTETGERVPFSKVFETMPYRQRIPAGFELHKMGAIEIRNAVSSFLSSDLAMQDCEDPNADLVEMLRPYNNLRLSGSRFNTAWSKKYGDEMRGLLSLSEAG